MDRIEGEVGDNAKNVAIGKDITQTTIRQGGPEWREFVARDLVYLERRTMILLWCVLVLFVAGAILTAATIRQIDLLYGRLERIEERIERRRPQPYYWPEVPQL